MKSINELTEITRVQSGGVFAVNNAEDTVTNKITIENLTSQIASAVEHDVNLVIGNSSSSTTDGTATNGNVHINLIENNTVDSSHSILGGGNISVTSDNSGNITISGSGTWDTAYAHSQVTSGNPHNVTASDVGLGNVGNFKAVSTAASQGLSSTEQANARANIGANASQPFNLALDGTTYGYLKTDGTTFVAFKSQADIDSAIAAAKVGTATADKVLTGYTFTNSTASGVSGSMTNNGAVSPSGLNCGGSYTVPVGYHNGSGVVTANSLASQTGVDSGKTAVTAAAMLSGYQGWVNGSKISGTMSSKAAATYNTSKTDQTIEASQYLSGVQTIKAVKTARLTSSNIKKGITITVGDANSASRIASVAGSFTGANTVSSGQTAAAAGQILDGYSAWVDGSEVKGSYTAPIFKSTKVVSIISNSWSAKTWNGLTNFDGSKIWTDGNNIYYSNGSNRYVLNKSTSTWSTKTWSGLTTFYGDMIWTDGTNIYYSYDSTQYVLNKATSTWSTKTWSGLTSFRGQYIWTDGTDIYYSDTATQYVLNKATSTWSTKTWSGLTSFDGSNIWTDGTDIYYSAGPGQYVLNKATSTWSKKTWNGLANIALFIGRYSIWTDGTDIYYSDTTTQYVLNKATSTWSTKTWSGLTSFRGQYIWTDGTNIYYSSGSTQYVLSLNGAFFTKPYLK